MGTPTQVCVRSCPNISAPAGRPFRLSKSFLSQASSADQQSLYNGKVLLEKHDPPAMYDSEETLQLAQESRLKMKQLNKEIKPTNYAKINQLSEKQLHFFQDFKSLAKEADESLAKHKALEYEIERLLRAAVSQNIMSIVQSPTVVETSDLQTELEPQTKIKTESLQEKLTDTIYENAKLRAQLFDKVSEQKDTSKGTSVNTKFVKPSIFGKPPSSLGTKLYYITPFPNTLSKPVTSHSVQSTQESKVVNNTKVIAPGMFRINPTMNSRNDREDIEKLGAKGDIGFFIGYYATSCAYRQCMMITFGQPSTAPRTAPAAPVPQVLHTQKASTTTADTSPTSINSSPQAVDIPNTSQDVDEPQQQHDQQQDDQVQLQSEIITDNVPNAMSDGVVFENPFAPPSTSAAESLSSQYVDPANMHTFYQPYQHDYQWTKDHPLEQVIGEPS
ncbi:hypothetical protein Tco_1394190 [Tanacetum coccineum]